MKTALKVIGALAVVGVLVFLWLLDNNSSQQPSSQPQSQVRGADEMRNLKIP